MQRQIHTFRAATISEAMDLVRQQLGQDAVVLESKEVATRRFLPWPIRKQEIEISAEVRSEQPKARRPRKAVAALAAAPRIVRTLAESLSERPAVPRLFAPLPELNLDTESEHLPLDESEFRQVNESADERSFTQNLANESVFARNSAAEVTPSVLQSLQALISQIEGQSRSWGPSELSPDLYRIIQKLRDVETDEDIARDLVAKLRQLSTQGTAQTPETLNAALTVLLEREMCCAAPLIVKKGLRSIVTLVGPTGVGKTTTLAKLAAHYQLNEGMRVGLITIDQYRVAAIEQLQTYAQILQIPLFSASTAEELESALGQLQDVDLVLIDTAGSNPFDDEKMSELHGLLRTVDSNHVILVLSLNSSARSLVRIADQFTDLAPKSMILTKLDESISGGNLLTVARQIPYPLLYCTTGQDVPHQIEPANPQRLAMFILQRDSFLQTINRSAC